MRCFSTKHLTRDIRHSTNDPNGFPHRTIDHAALQEGSAEGRPGAKIPPADPAQMCPEHEMQISSSA